MSTCDYNSKPFANPGKYYDRSSFYDRGYCFYPLVGEKFTAKTCHLQEGTKLLSIFGCTDIQHDNNAIVFFAVGDEENIVAEYRKIVKDPFGIYILNVPYIEKVTKYGPLPPVFDSPYGRWVENTKCFKEAAVSGNDRLVRNVFQQAVNGKMTPSDGQAFLLEFGNGEVAMALADGSWNKDYTIPMLMYVNPENEDKRKKDKYDRENKVYAAWVKEEGIEDHNLPEAPAETPPVVNMPIAAPQLPEFTLYQRALNWVRSFSSGK